MRIPFRQMNFPQGQVTAQHFPALLELMPVGLQVLEQVISLSEEQQPDAEDEYGDQNGGGDKVNVVQSFRSFWHPGNQSATKDQHQHRQSHAPVTPAQGFAPDLPALDLRLFHECCQLSPKDSVV